MGQYFIGYLLDPETGEEFKIDPLGSKLMEHSYYGNDFVNLAMRSLTSYPKRVWWVGDYAEANDFKKELNEGIDPMSVHRSTSEFNSFDYLANDIGRYLVNYRKKQYIDLVAHRFDQARETGIHPLPLLTAVGNGRGGGDFVGQCDNLVGNWAGDLIGATNYEPEGMTDITTICDFKEE